MFSVWTVAAIALCYLLILFILAFWGDRRFKDNQQHPIVYSLAMGVHCTSWAFFGTTTQAAQYGWAFIPTYLGIILVMVFAFPVLRQIAQVCHRNQISSLADFIGLQFQKSHMLAAMVSILCFFGVVPYIALQLDAVSRGFEIITEQRPSWLANIGLYVTALMALFAILFGTRTMSLTDKHPGLMLTIAFESVVKLGALLFIGLFVCYVMFDGLMDVFAQASASVRGREIIYADNAIGVFISHVILGICAMFCLPRQFHINFIENNGDQELRTARWIFPLYLIAMTFFVLPIALAGHVLFDVNSVSTDTYALALPVLADNSFAALVSFIGGLSAATSMVIVATLAVGIMISNNLVTPLWLTLQISTGRQHSLTPSTLLFIRRLTVVLVLGVAYLYYLDVSQGSQLVKSGTIAIALLSQTMPIIILGMYWSKGHKVAAQIALICGAMCWFYWLLWPSIKASYYFEPAPTDWQLGQGFLLSLLVNVVCFIGLSLVLPNSKKTVKDLHSKERIEYQALKVSKLLALTDKVLESTKQKELSKMVNADQNDGYANPILIEKVERELAAHVGGASARILLSAVADKDQVALPELVELVEEATQSFQFNHALLQSSVEHIQQGICVLDQDLNVLACNQRYIEMFEYPLGIVAKGKPIRDLLIYNAKRGMFGSDKNAQDEIDKRINFMKQGSRYKYIRTHTTGKVVEINGSPLPTGGYVTTYSDITEYIDIQHQLEDAKTGLENRVEKRTRELNEVNIALSAAKKEAEYANESKTKFLAAAGHDLMQPFNAASLFASLLEQKATNKELRELSHNLVQSLSNAEELLTMLLDMTKLESGRLVPHKQPFKLSEIMTPLVNEFSMIAHEKGLTLRYVKTDEIVFSDKKLLRRIVQNLISNAIRYTKTGRILIGIRRSGDFISLSVFDTGPGIAVENQKFIFEEFSQLNSEHSSHGLGLGLTIVDKISNLLGHKVHLDSIVDKGTCFTVLLPKGQLSTPHLGLPKNNLIDTHKLLDKLTVLVVENEQQTLHAITQLLESWGANVLQASSIKESEKIDSQIDLMLLDYHLDAGETGIQVACHLRAKSKRYIPGILNSADRTEKTRNEASKADLYFLPKPLKTPVFKHLLRQILQPK